MNDEIQEYMLNHSNNNENANESIQAYVEWKDNTRFENVWDAWNPMDFDTYMRNR